MDSTSYNITGDPELLELLQIVESRICISNAELVSLLLSIAANPDYKPNIRRESLGNSVISKMIAFMASSSTPS